MDIFWTKFKHGYIVRSDFKNAFNLCSTVRKGIYPPISPIDKQKFTVEFTVNENQNLHYIHREILYKFIVRKALGDSTVTFNVPHAYLQLLKDMAMPKVA